MKLFRLLLRLRRKRDPLIGVLTQERDYLRGQVETLQARINVLEAHVLDANDRLLVREGAYRKTEPTASPVIDPLAHESNEDWELRSEQQEIEDHVARMKADPTFAMFVEDARHFDDRWARVYSAAMEQVQ